MNNVLRRLISDDRGANVLEYALVAVGVIAAVFQPSLFVAAFYRLSDVFRLFASQVSALF